MISLQEVLQGAIARDERDMQRAICPLRKADAAIEVDTSDKSVEEVLQFMTQCIG